MTGVDGCCGMTPFCVSDDGFGKLETEGDVGFEDALEERAWKGTTFELLVGLC